MTEITEITGWAVFFRLEDSPQVFYNDYEEADACLALRTPRKPWSALFSNINGEKPVKGFYKIVGDHLFRVLAAAGGTPTWDVSVRAADGTYDFQSEGRAIDKIWCTGTYEVVMLAPAGFPLTIRAAEKRIEQFRETLNAP